MARPRTNQFAKDMGMSRKAARNLIARGRKKKDKGSAILGRTVQAAKAGKAVRRKK